MPSLKIEQAEMPEHGTGCLVPDPAEKFLGGDD